MTGDNKVDKHSFLPMETPLIFFDSHYVRIINSLQDNELHGQF